MAREWKSRPPAAKTSITECARRYHAAAAALARTFGVPLTAEFVREYHPAISCVFIESGRAEVRLPASVTLAPLSATTVAAVERYGPLGPVAEDATMVAPPNGQPERPTTIPAASGLPCAGQEIADLTPPQLHMLCGKVGVRALADKALEPLHVALLAERARRLQAAAGANGHGASR
jgi:hypothetical protein